MGSSSSTVDISNFECSQIDNDEKIINACVISCRIFHGSYSWLASTTSNILSSSSAPPLEHHCLRIKTDGYYYVVQIFPGGREIVRCNSKRESRNRLFDAAGKKYNPHYWIECKKNINCSTMGCIKKFAFDWGNDYHRIARNCQHFARAGYNLLS